MSPTRAEPLLAACHTLGITTIGLWMDVLTLGGNLSPSDIEAFLGGGPDLDDHSYDLIVQVLNERLREQGHDNRLRFADELHRRRD